MKWACLLLASLLAAVGGGLVWHHYNGSDSPETPAAPAQTVQTKASPRRTVPAPQIPPQPHRAAPRPSVAAAKPAAPASAAVPPVEDEPAPVLEVVEEQRAAPPPVPAVVLVSPVPVPEIPPVPPVGETPPEPTPQPEPEITDADLYHEASALLAGDPLAAAQMAARMSRGRERTELVSEAFRRMASVNFRKALEIAGQTDDPELAMAAAASTFAGAIETKQIKGDRAALERLMFITRAGMEFAAAADAGRPAPPKLVAAAVDVLDVSRVMSASMSWASPMQGSMESAAIEWMRSSAGDNAGSLFKDLIAADRQNAGAAASAIGRREK